MNKVLNRDIMNVIVFVSALLLLEAGNLFAQKNAIGRPLPDFEKYEWVVPDTVSNDFFKNKVVVLDFWATWCKPCLKETPRMNEMARKYKDRGVVFVTVSWDRSRAAVDTFVKTSPMESIVCIDPEGSILLKHYKAWSIPYLILVGRDGNAVWEGLGQTFTTDVLDSFLLTNSVPADVPLEKRTRFSFEVHDALPSDKNSVRSEIGTNNYLECIGVPADAIILNTLSGLNIRYHDWSQTGSTPSGFYGSTLRIDSAAITPQIQSSVMQQMDAVFNSKTTVEMKEFELYVITVEDSALFEMHVQRSKIDTTSKSTADTFRFDNMRVYSLLGHFNRQKDFAYYVEDRKLGEMRIDVEYIPTDAEGKIKTLKNLGLKASKEIRRLPFVTIAFHEEQGSDNGDQFRTGK